jgi:hypothetical protein
MVKSVMSRTAALAARAPYQQRFDIFAYFVVQSAQPRTRRFCSASRIPNSAFRSSLGLLDKCAVLKLFKGELQLFLRVHDNRTVPCHRLANWFAGDQQKPRRFGFG